MRWLDDVSTDLRKMGINEWRDRARDRGLEAYCKGGQGPRRAVASSKKKKNQVSYIMKNLRVGVELFRSDGRTDGRTDKAKLIVAFRNFVKAPKN